MYESRDEREIKRRQRRRQRQHHRVTETRCALWNWNIVRHMGDATSHVNRMTTTTSSTTLLCRRATARVNVCACYLFVVGIFSFVSLLFCFFFFFFTFPLGLTCCRYTADAAVGFVRSVFRCCCYYVFCCLFFSLSVCALCGNRSL